MLHKFKITSYTFILCLAALLVMTVSPGSAKESSKEPRWLQDEICHEYMPEGERMKYNWREQMYTSMTAKNVGGKIIKSYKQTKIWCKPKEHSEKKYKQRSTVKEAKSKKSVPSCIPPRAYEKVLRLVKALQSHDTVGRARHPAAAFVDWVIPGVNINEYNLQIAKGIEAWTEFGHCAYKKCSEVGKFDPDTGEKSLCMDESGNVFGEGRDKYGRLRAHRWD